MNPAQNWLGQLTEIPTTSGREQGVEAWVRARVARRRDLVIRADSAGNLLITVGDDLPADPVIAVAHMDHPGFVVESVGRQELLAQFRGGVMSQYFLGARVEFFDRGGRSHPGSIAEDLGSDRYRIQSRSAAGLAVDDIGWWRFDKSALGFRGDRFRAHACDDLAGVAAGLAALDRSRKRPELHGFAVLLTRAEEEGFIGAIAAAKSRSIPPGGRLLSIETSRSFANTPLGSGPIVRVGDLSSVFDHHLTNAVSEVARRSGLAYQRRLMDGGSCEATAFGAYGYRATGLCLALENYHNMADIDGVKNGIAPARIAPEEISLADFGGLVQLLLACAGGIDSVDDSLTGRLDRRFLENRHLLN